MAIRAFLLDWGIEMRKFSLIPFPAPQFQWITSVELFTRKWNALQAQVFVKATCNYPDDGMLCEVRITGKHEFLEGGVSTTQMPLFI